jgi:splicing factor 3B subunit 1
MSPTIEDPERHLLVKLLDRLLHRLEELVRPHAHNLLKVVQPLLLDQNYYARVEARELIANLAKAAGLATMITTLRLDIDSTDEYVRNVTARALAVVASALGVPALVPFLKAAAASRKCWEARHSGIKVVQQVAILMGSAVLPSLGPLVEVAQPGLTDESTKVRCMAALAISALAEAAYPYGIDAFDAALRPLWEGVRANRGKTLAAFLKAIGFVVPLMSPEHAGFYVKHVMEVVVREFASADEEMRKIVLRTVRQLIATEGLDAGYVRATVLPPFMRAYWVRRSALDKRNWEPLVEATADLASKVGQIITEYWQYASMASPRKD